jgi:hypothetical protein
MKFILARKERMTQIFDEAGMVHAGTLLTVGPTVVTQVKTKDSKDKYDAVQVGYDAQTEKRLNKAQHKKAFKVLKEFRVDDASAYSAGQALGVETFAVGEAVRGRTWRASERGAAVSPSACPCAQVSPKCETRHGFPQAGTELVAGTGCRLPTCRPDGATPSIAPSPMRQCTHQKGVSDTPREFHGWNDRFSGGRQPSPDHTPERGCP